MITPQVDRNPGKANPSPARATERIAKQAVSQAEPWVTRLARLGYAAKGVIYLIIGVLAMEASLGTGRQPTNTLGALEVILHEPFGRLLLGIVAVGLFGYAAWRILLALLGPGRAGNDSKGLLKRLGYVVSAIAYGSLAYTAVRLLNGSSVHHGNPLEAWTGRFLGMPFGKGLVLIIGLVILCVGLYGFYNAYAAPFRNNLDLSDLSGDQRRMIVAIGRFGYAARGVVFCVIGPYLMQAALRFDPHRVRGLQGAQQTLAHRPGGHGILLLVAAGLCAYGVFMLIEARYRQVQIPAA
jgi:hypothetical protein